MLSKIILMGRLTRDPELTEAGIMVAKVQVAAFQKRRSRGKE